MQFPYLGVHEHPLDVLNEIQSITEKGQKSALVMVTSVEGGGVRKPGAMMAVSEAGQLFGYVSGGCVDADVATQAQECMASGEVRHIRYGLNSEFKDLPLPCGGAIEIMILPDPSANVILQWQETLTSRSSCGISITRSGTLAFQHDEFDRANGWMDHIFYANYRPKLKLRVAGRGADFQAFANIVSSIGYDLELQTPDAPLKDQVENMSEYKVTLLQTPNHLPSNDDDPWTAFVLMFHDRDWETSLLRNAFEGDAFYIGAVGSWRAHQKRCTDLLSAGATQAQIDRIHAPIGLVPKLRNATSIVISSLAEIISVFEAEGK